jgi:hypothetical protein
VIRGSCATYPEKKQQFAALNPISALSPQCQPARNGADLCTVVGFNGQGRRAAANQPDLCLGLLLLAAWLASNAHVPGKTAPQTSNALWGLGQFAQPSCSLSFPSRRSQEHQLSSSCCVFQDQDLDVDVIELESCIAIIRVDIETVS